VDPRPGDVLRLMADSSAASRTLGFAPTVALADGIADLVSRFRAMPPAQLTQLASRLVVKNWQ
jgi:UDP-glucose 4-epimerase